MNNKGMSATLLLLIAGVLIAGIFLYLRNVVIPMQQSVEDVKVVETKTMEKEEPFEPIKETKNIPSDIDNTVVKELDDIVTSVDDETDDLSDIEY